jgi:hypothetical protein
VSDKERKKIIVNFKVNEDQYKNLIINSDGNISEYIRKKCCGEPSTTQHKQEQAPQQVG